MRGLGTFCLSVSCVIHRSFFFCQAFSRILKPGFGALLRRCKAVNNRNAQSAKTDYEAGIFAVGLRQGVRSVCVLKEFGDAFGPECRDVLAAAHTTEGLIECWHEQPKNTQVIQSIKAWLPPPPLPPPPQFLLVQRTAYYKAHAFVLVSFSL